MNSQQLREQFMEDRGGIFNPEQRVEVNINGVWVPGTIASIANYTVRNTATGRNAFRQPNEVRTVNHGILDTGENTNIMPGSQVEFKRSNNWNNAINGTLVSKNYFVDIDNDRRIEIVPHTRLRRAPEGPPPDEPPSPEGPPSPPQPAPGYNFEENQEIDALVNGVWRPGQIAEIVSYTVSATGTQHNVAPHNIRGQGANLRINSPVEFRQVGRRGWLPGILTDIDYLVNIVDGGMEDVTYSNLRPRTALPPPPQPEVQGRLDRPELMRGLQRQNAMTANDEPHSPEGPPPPPEGPRLPQHDYEQNEEVDALVDGVWRPGQIGGIETYHVGPPGADGVYAFLFTPENIPENMRGQYRLGTRQRHNLRVNSPVEFRQGNRWLPGTIVQIDYWVNMVDYRGGLETVSQLNLRPRAAVQPRVAAAQPRAAAAQPRAVVQPAEDAFQVHTEFDAFKASKWNKFMEIINRTTGTNTNFRNRRAPLQPLIDYVSANASYSPEKKAEIIQKINRIFTQIQDYGNYEQNIDNITNCIQYVLMQPPEFIDAYINTFVVDCFKAYSRGSPESCTKGMYERIYLSFRDTASTLCLDQIQGVSAAPLCKPEYIEIYDCFYDTFPQKLLNDYSSEWYTERGDEALLKLTPEQRIEDFVGFVRTRVNNPVRFGKAEASIRRYANKEINILFGGRRRNSKKRQAKRVKKTVKRRETNKKRSGGKKQRGSKKRSVKKR